MLTTQVKGLVFSGTLNIGTGCNVDDGVLRVHCDSGSCRSYTWSLTQCRTACNAGSGPGNSSVFICGDCTSASSPSNCPNGISVASFTDLVCPYSTRSTSTRSKTSTSTTPTATTTRTGSTPTGYSTSSTSAGTIKTSSGSPSNVSSLSTSGTGPTATSSTSGTRSSSSPIPVTPTGKRTSLSSVTTVPSASMSSGQSGTTSGNASTTISTPSTRTSSGAPTVSTVSTASGGSTITSSSVSSTSTTRSNQESNPSTIPSIPPTNVSTTGSTSTRQNMTGSTSSVYSSSTSTWPNITAFTTSTASRLNVTLITSSSSSPSITGSTTVTPSSGTFGSPPVPSLSSLSHGATTISGISTTTTTTTSSSSSTSTRSVPTLPSVPTLYANCSQPRIEDFIVQCRGVLGISCGDGTCVPFEATHMNCIDDCPNGIDETCFAGEVKCVMPSGACACRARSEVLQCSNVSSLIVYPLCPTSTTHPSTTTPPTPPSPFTLPTITSSSGSSSSNTPASSGSPSTTTSGGTSASSTPRTPATSTTTTGRTTTSTTTPTAATFVTPSSSTKSSTSTNSTTSLSLTTSSTTPTTATVSTTSSSASTSTSTSTSATSSTTRTSSSSTSRSSTSTTRSSTSTTTSRTSTSRSSSSTSTSPSTSASTSRSSTSTSTSPSRSSTSSTSTSTSRSSTSTSTSPSRSSTSSTSTSTSPSSTSRSTSTSTSRSSSTSRSRSSPSTRTSTSTPSPTTTTTKISSSSRPVTSSSTTPTNAVTSSSRSSVTSTKPTPSTRSTSSRTSSTVQTWSPPSSTITPQEGRGFVNHSRHATSPSSVTISTLRTTAGVGGDSGSVVRPMSKSTQGPSSIAPITAGVVSGIPIFEYRNASICQGDVCRCMDGYIGDGISCVIDQCSTMVCGVNAYCKGAWYRSVNGQFSASFNCMCDSDLQGDPYSGCYKSACESDFNNCSKDAICTNGQTFPNFTCKCKPGYVGDGLQCQHPCLANASSCDANAFCVPSSINGTTTGNYSCFCLWPFDGNGQQCQKSSNTTSPCPKGFFTCPSDRTCIPCGWVHDQVADCKLGEDELPTAVALCPGNVSLCDSNAKRVNRSMDTYKCSCIPPYVGDGFHCFIPTPGSGVVTWRPTRTTSRTATVTSATPPARCGEYQFRCPTGSIKCIPCAWVKDGTNDCDYGEDETEVGLQQCGVSSQMAGVSGVVTHRPVQTSTVSTASCNDQQYKCASNGQCIPCAWVNDGVNDCPDAADEAPVAANACKKTTGAPALSTPGGCDPTKQFRCTSDGSCIPVQWVNDSVRDCPNGEDEQAGDHDQTDPCHNNGVTCDSHAVCTASSNGGHACVCQKPYYGNGYSCWLPRKNKNK